jgi:hypothetical protein
MLVAVGGIMFFRSLRMKRNEESDKVARFIVAGGKRRFVIRTSLPAAVIPWFAMNLFFFARFRSEGIEGTFLAGLELVTLLISTLFGFVLSLKMWSRFERLAKSDFPQ